LTWFGKGTAKSSVSKQELLSSDIQGQASFPELRSSLSQAIEASHEVPQNENKKQQCRPWEIFLTGIRKRMKQQSRRFTLPISQISRL
jgi:hypothetical protein